MNLIVESHCLVLLLEFPTEDIDSLIRLGSSRNPLPSPPTAANLTVATEWIV